MLLKEKLSAISLWNEVRDNPNALKEILNQGNSFILKLPQSIDLKSEPFVHTYPGLINGRLSFFLIPSLLDKETLNNKDLNQAIEMIEVINQPHPPKLEGLPLPEEEAYRRLNLWKNSSDIWIEKQVKSLHGVYQCFGIPTKELELGHEYIVYFSLKNLNPVIETNHVADLVLWDQKREAVIYPKNESDDGNFYDTVWLVPPFGKDELKKDNFYTLSLALEIETVL